MLTMRAALVIPAWNEAESIGAVLAEVPPGAVGQVFVVTGDSTDGTAEIAAAHGAQVVSQPRPGYGAACLAGARAAARAGAQVVAFLDGDYSDPPGDLPRMLAPVLVGTADLVLGCRGLGVHPEALPLHARIGNRLVVGTLSVLLGQRLRDLPSFKAIRLEHLEKLDMREMTYGWTTELIVKSVRAELRVAEVPIAYRPRLAGQSKVSGTLQGTLGAAWKLCSCATRYARWTPEVRGGAAVWT
jgi:glycosyltransferase involved in cell wall biosynthesis